MYEHLMRQIDKHTNTHTYEVTITYTTYIDTYSEHDAKEIAYDEIKDYVENDTPEIWATQID